MIFHLENQYFTIWKIIKLYKYFMNNEKINSKIKLLNIFRYFDIRNFEILKYWSFYIPSFQISNPAQKLANFKINCLLDISHYSQFCRFSYFPFDINEFRRFIFSIFIFYCSDS